MIVTTFVRAGMGWIDMAWGKTGIGFGGIEVLWSQHSRLRGNGSLRFGLWHLALSLWVLTYISKLVLLEVVKTIDVGFDG